MNFVSKFDDSFSISGIHPKAQTHVESITTKAPADSIIVPDAQLLFTGDFKRSGSDLVISKGDHELRLADYFKGEKHAPLASPDGAYLTGSLVDALTGHVQVAQADGSASAVKIIGHVTKLNGNATVIRNGVSIILNNGENVHQGDVVQTGSSSTLGITFIDGSVFGLASNAKMVLNEVVYDPNGSNNSSLMSLVSGTISFVAGATAKHGDMKVDTPVATMGIRGTACLVEIEFDLSVVQPATPGLAPPVKFQVLVEPDGTTGSYVLLERSTLLPMATVNQAGTVTTVSGTGAVSFLASAQLSPEVMKLISEVFSQKYTDNSNPKSDTHFTDTPVPDATFGFKFANGDPGVGVIRVSNTLESPTGPGSNPTGPPGHIPGKPEVHASNGVVSERDLLTGSSLEDKTSGIIPYKDVNPGDIPTARTAFAGFAYQDAHGNNVTATLTAAQKAAIANISVPLIVVQDPSAQNNGTATWTYKIPDGAADFLADGEKLTLIYTAFVDTNFAPANETGTVSFTVTLTGTNDAPTIVVEQTNATGGVVEDSNVNASGNITADGTITFNDVDLTDTHTASFAFSSSHASASLPGFADNTSIGTFALVPVSEVPADGDTTGSLGWTFTLDDSNPVLQSLAEGQTITLVYIVTVSDGHGGTVDQEVTITITGSNDSPNHAPTIVGELTTATGDVTEDIDVNASEQIAADGTITFRDVDLIDTHTVSFVPASSTSNAHLPGFTNNTTYVGTFALNPVSEDNTDTINTGSVGWTFTLDDSNPILQSLAEGQTITQVYTVTISDNHGGMVNQDVTVTITGTNDAPTIETATTTASGGVTEDTAVNASNAITTNGTIAFQDLDLIDTHTASFVPASSTSNVHLPGFTDTDYIGTFALANSVTENNTDTISTASVGWTFTVDDSNPILQSLAEGQTITQVYTVTVYDGHIGGIVTQDVSVTITGTNDTPTIDAATTTATGGVIEDAAVDASNNITTSGAVGFQDVDLIDTHTAGFVNKSSTSGTALPGFINNLNYIGTFALDPVSESNTDTISTASVGWTFTLDDDDPTLQSLAEGQTVTQVYTVTVDDGHTGGTVTKDVTVTITGTNDAPTIDTAATTASGGVTEDTNVNASNEVTTSGTVGFNDVDLIDTHSASFVEKSSTSNASLPGFVDNSTYIGTFALDPVSEDNTDTTTAGSVGWTFNVDDDDPTLQSLAAGEIITQVYTITVYDGHTGGTVTKDVTVTITGTNDKPTIDTAATTASGGVTEDTNINASNEITTSGAVGFNDVDLIDTHTATFVEKSSTSNASLPGFVDNSTYIGTFALDPVSEDTADTNPAGSVHWHFTLDDDDPTLQSLAAGETITQVYTITVYDGHTGGTVTKDVTVTITGTNDVPTVVVADTTASGGVTEDTNVNASNAIAAHGAVAFKDVDLIDLHAASFVLKSSDANANLPGFTEGSGAGAASIGTFALTVSENNTDTNPAGSVGWTFTLDDSNPTLQSLAAGQTITQIYTVAVPDGHAGGTVTKDVTVTVTGTNDKPTIDVAATTASGGVTEDTNVSSGKVATNGTIGFQDVDLIDAHTASFVPKSSSSSIALPGFTGNTSYLGTFALNAVNENNTDTNPAGSVGWTFKLDDNDPTLQSLGEGQTITQVYTVTVSDGHTGGTITQDVTVTITGKNDAPSIVAESNPPVHGVMVVNPASVIVEPAGQNTNSLGLDTETFNSKTSGLVSINGFGTGNFTSSTLGATFTASGHAGIVHGSLSASAAPLMGPLPGSADSTNYLSIGGGATETITFATSKNAFGMYWGSVDSYNTIKFYDGATLVGSYTGADISPLLSSGNQGSFTANGYVEFVTLHSFNKVVLGSSSNAFEIDNISAGNVPASHAVLAGTVSGTMSVHDVDIGDTLTGVVSQSATFLFNNSSTLPNGVSLADILNAGNITFDSVQSDGGTDILHWSYDPHGADLDFLHAGDVLKLTYTAQVSDGHGSSGSQQLTVTLVGTDNGTNVSTLQFVDGTTGNDIFNNVGGGTTLFGNGGHDNFAFKPGSGSATIADFQPGDDVITFASSMFNHNPANVIAAAHDDGLGNTIISLGGPDTITLQHVQAAHLSASDFHFV